MAITPDACCDPALADRLARGSARPRGSRASRVRFAPQLTYGRHFGPPAHDARAAAVLVLLYWHDGQWFLPLTVRPTELVDHGGQISFPGGLMEPGETVEQAAVRELEEELGVPATAPSALCQLSPTYVFVSNFLVTPVIATLEHRPRWRPNPREVAEVLEVPLIALFDRSRVGRHAQQANGIAYTVPHIQWGQHRIWGATSIMLGELAEVIREC